MEYSVVRSYCQDDPEFMGDACDVTLFLGDKVILTGDWYHDKIEDKIDGYLQAIHDITGKRPIVNYTRKISDEY